MPNVSAPTAAIPFVWHPRTRRHLPGSEIRMGIRVPALGVPERVTSIRTALIAAGHPEVAGVDPALEDLHAVHDPALVEHLRSIYDAWLVGGYPTDPGQDRVVPSVFPTDAMLDGLALRRASAAPARAGQFCYDTMTLVGPGTWDAVEAAAGTAVTAVDVVWPAGASDALVSTRPMSVYALCRPPGHHATRAAAGGGCYLNNAAIAAARLRACGAQRVGVLDLGALHGNGTQTIFYDQPTVLTASVHVDPGAGWFPHFLGFADETGLGAGADSNLNLPLAPRADEDRWLGAVAQAIEWIGVREVDALVVALGVDVVASGPGSPMRVTEEGLAAAGALVGAAGLPTVVVQEAGFHLPTLGHLVVRFLAGLAAGATGGSTD